MWRFVLEHNGGEGEIGESWAQLWPVEQLAYFNDLYSHLDHVVGLMFGTNGNLELYVFDAAEEVFLTPFLGDAEDAIPQGPFSAFVRRMAEDQLFESKG